MRKFEGVCAHTATDIQDLGPRLQAEAIKDRRFPGDRPWEFVRLVKEPKKDGGISSLVDAGEMRHVLATHKRASHIS